MTVVVAYRGHLAADRRAANGNNTPFPVAGSKIHVFKSGEGAVAIAGLVSLSREMSLQIERNFEEGRHRWDAGFEPGNEATALVVYRGKHYVIHEYPYPVEVTLPVAAIGSGAPFAQGAALALIAREPNVAKAYPHRVLAAAITIANKLDLDCGNGGDIWAPKGSSFHGHGRLVKRWVR